MLRIHTSCQKFDAVLENLEPQPRGAEVTAGTTKHEHVCRYRYANPPARVCTNQITSANIQNPRACSGSEALLNIVFTFTGSNTLL